MRDTVQSISFGGAPARSAAMVVLAGIMFLTGSAGAAQEGALSVITDPPGVEVWLGDAYIGDSPITGKKLKTGRYSVRLVDPIQHVSITEEVMILPGETVMLEKTLKAKFGGLSVNSEPRGAKVYLSMPLGATPLTNNFVKPGKYRVELRHESGRYSTALENVLVPQGTTVEVSKTLKRIRLLDTPALLRLAFGGGAIAGYWWAVSEQRWDNKRPRNFGLLIGTVCVIAFEVVGFF